MQDLDGNYNFDLPTFEEALQMEKIDVPTMGKVNQAFEESPPDYEPPSYQFDFRVISGITNFGPDVPGPEIEVPIAGSQLQVDETRNVSVSSSQSLQQEFQPAEETEERTATPIIPVRIYKMAFTKC